MQLPTVVLGLFPALLALLMVVAYQLSFSNMMKEAKKVTKAQPATKYSPQSSKGEYSIDDQSYWVKCFHYLTKHILNAPTAKGAVEYYDEMCGDDKKQLRLPPHKWTSSQLNCLSNLTDFLYIRMKKLSPSIKGAARVKFEGYLAVLTIGRLNLLEAFLSSGSEDPNAPDDGANTIRVIQNLTLLGLDSQNYKMSSDGKRARLNWLATYSGELTAEEQKEAEEHVTSIQMGQPMFIRRPIKRGQKLYPLYPSPDKWLVELEDKTYQLTTNWNGKVVEDVISRLLLDNDKVKGKLPTPLEWLNATMREAKKRYEDMVAEQQAKATKSRKRKK